MVRFDKVRLNNVIILSPLILNSNMAKQKKLYLTAVLILKIGLPVYRKVVSIISCHIFIKRFHIQLLICTAFKPLYVRCLRNFLKLRAGNLNWL